MKTLNVLNKKGNAKTTFAILNPNKYYSANVTDGTLYIGADSFKTDQWAKDLAHEVTHLEEGTKEYNKLFNYLNGDDILVDDGKGGKISLYTRAANTVRGKGYGIETDTINEIINKVNNDEILTAQEQKGYNLFKSELTAHESELYLGSEAFIDKIIESDTSLAKKIFDKIFNTKQALQKVDKNNEEVKKLLKAEKLWLNASKRIGNIQLAKYIQGKEKELEENSQEGVENEQKVQYNLSIRFSFQHKNFPGEKDTWSEAHRLAVWWAAKADTETGDRTLISMHGKWYLVEKFDDAENNYQVEEYITKAEFEQIFKEIKEYGRSGQIKSVQGSTDFIDKLNKSGGTVGSKKPSIDSNGTQYRGKDNQIQRMDKTTVGGRERTSSDRSGDSESSGTNKQGNNLNKSQFNLKQTSQTLENIEEKYKPYVKYLFINENDTQIKLSNTGKIFDILIEPKYIS